MNILRIAARISATCVESKTRHKDPGNKFDLNKFKSLSGHEAFKYAKDRLQLTGKGSSRAVFILNSSKVLKIAVNNNRHEVGLAQNKTEVDFYTNPKTKQVCAKIFDFDPNYEWLISELVKPVSETEFKKLTGVSVYDLKYLKKGLDLGLNSESLYEHYSEDNNIQDIDPFPKDLFIKWTDIFKNLIDQGSPIGELTNPEHWGKTPSGNLVVLDYGLTDEIYDKYYRLT